MLDPGDLLVAYADGVIDAHAGDGRRFGEVALRRLVGTTAGGPAEIVALSRLTTSG